MKRFCVVLAAITLVFIVVPLNVGCAAGPVVPPGTKHAAPQARVHDFGDVVSEVDLRL